MLSKLIKHEWKDTYMIGTVCCIITIVLSVIGMLLFSLDIWNESASRSDVAEQFTSIIIMLYFMTVIYGIAGIVLVMRYYFFYRYHKHLFTDQGYLLNTLPVKSSDLIKSKLLVAVIWQYITFFVVGISVFLLIMSMSMGLTGYTLAEFGEEFAEFWRDLCRVMAEPEAMELIPAGLSYLVILIVGPIADMLLMYTAVGIGQLSKKFKFLMAILVLIGFNLVIQTVTSFATIPFSLMMDQSETMMGFNIFMVLFAVVMTGGAVGMYYLSKYFLTHKLNLE